MSNRNSKESVVSIRIQRGTEIVRRRQKGRKTYFLAYYYIKGKAKSGACAAIVLYYKPCDTRVLYAA